MAQKQSKLDGSVWAQLRTQQIPQLPRWEGTLGQYLELLPSHPEYTDTAVQRLWRMVESAGITPGEVPQYHFFDHILFGVEEPLAQVMRFIQAGAQGLSLKQRVLLLVGPPGSGKSTFATAIKDGLERFTRTEAGRVFGIAGCPMHEDPLNALSLPMWEELSRILQRPLQPRSLCPHCRMQWKDTPLEEIPVVSVVFSQRDRIGIGTYFPPDPQDATIASLVGTSDLSMLKEYGSEADPRAYLFEGELNVANRGVLEFIEMLKAPTQHLYPLLTATQEQQIKTDRFGLMDVDEVLISHTNYREYQRFIAEPRNEALVDRMFIVHFPYPLRFPDEVAVYKKLWTAPVHVDPHLFEVMAVYAELTRVVGKSAADGTNKTADLRFLLDKVLWYGGSGENKDARMREEFWKEQRSLYPLEGTTGLSPRRLLDVLDAQAAGSACVNTPQFILQWVSSLKTEHHAGMSATQRAELLTNLEILRDYYNGIVKADLQEAFFEAFDQNAESLFRRYLEQIQYLVQGKKITDPFSGALKDPDRKFVESVEGAIGIAAAQAPNFRTQVLVTLTSLYQNQTAVNWKAYPPLARAIKVRLFQDSQQLMRTTFSDVVPDDAQREKLREVQNRLIDQRGYCPICAQELLKYAPQIFNE